MEVGKADHGCRSGQKSKKTSQYDEERRLLHAWQDGEMLLTGLEVRRNSPRGIEDCPCLFMKACRAVERPQGTTVRCSFVTWKKQRSLGISRG